jgi:tetratricopeptide (TPR) repeat protein
MSEAPVNSDAAAKKALSLAKAEKYSAALGLADSLDLKSLNESSLKNLALAYSYAGKLEQSELCWLTAIDRFEAGSGYNYMLGSIQSQLSKNQDAIFAFERELAHCLKANETFYLSSTALRLAQLYIADKRVEDAKNLMQYVNDSDNDYVPTLGNLNKKKLLEMLKTK